MEQIEQKSGIADNKGEVNWDKESTFSRVKSSVADKLHSAAESLHQTAARGNQESDLSELGQRAAAWLKHSGDYVSEVQPERVRYDLENQVRRNPGRSLLIAGAVGLLLGGLFRRR